MSPEATRAIAKSIKELPCTAHMGSSHFKRPCTAALCLLVMQHANAALTEVTQNRAEVCSIGHVDVNVGEVRSSC